MTNSPTEVIAILNSLIGTCKDGQEGFRIAAENINDDQELKTLLNQYSLQRAKFAAELQTQARNFGELDPERESSMAGSIHRGWINLKSAVSNRDKRGILAECERGEDVAVAEYKKAVEAGLPVPLNGIIQSQSQEIIVAHNRIRFLRDSTVEETRNRFQTLQEKGSELGATAAETWERTKGRAQDLIKTSGSYLRENPVPAIVGALSVGLAVGLLVRYLEHSHESESATEEHPRNTDTNTGLKALLIPFLWPIFKAVKNQYNSSAIAAKKTFKKGRSKSFDVNKYVRPIVKKVKRIL